MALVLTALATIFIIHLTQPTRSVANYCKAYNLGATALGTAGGNTYTYSTSVFPNASSNNPGTFIPVFNRLDSVAPPEIEPQVKAMKDIWIEMKNNPTETLSAALNGLPAEQAVTQWTQQHCGS